MAKAHKTRLAEAHKALRDAIKAHTKDGMVKVYPTEPVGEAMVPNVPAIAQDVEPAEAEKLLSFRPAAFTLSDSGKPPKEHAEIDELDSEQAWGVADPEDAPDEVSAMEPPFRATQPEPPVGESED